MQDQTANYRGLFAIAGGHYSFLDLGDGIAKGAIPPLPRKHSVTIQERVFRKVGKLAPGVTDPVSAIVAAKKVSNGKDGIMLLNSQNEPAAFIPMSVLDMESLGESPAMRSRMYSAFEIANASTMMAVTHGDMRPLAVGKGLDSQARIAQARALADAGADATQGITARALSVMRHFGAEADVKLLDAISLKDRESARQAGLTEPEPEPDLLIPYTDADIKQREADLLALSKRDAATRKAADDKAIADAQRDAFALTGSDRPADDLGQSTLFEPAHGYPGTIDDPMPRESLMAAADARVAEAEKSEPALMAAVNCALSQGEA